MIIELATRAARALHRRVSTGTAPNRRPMPTHRMKIIAACGSRALFSGSIPAGTGGHDYVCGRCKEVILRSVDVRHPSAGVYECPKCEALNVVARMEQTPEEVAERFTRLYSEHSDVPARDRRKEPR